jgi:hypothetical protein
VAQLEELQAGTRVIGLMPGPAITVKSATWIGQQAVELVFEDAKGALHKRLVYREDKHTLGVAQAGRPWLMPTGTSSGSSRNRTASSSPGCSTPTWP